MRDLTLRARKLSRGNGPVAALARLSALSDHDGAVFDVGVNKGTVARHLIRIFPDCPAHLFEPLPRQAAALRERFAEVGNLSVVQAALGEHEGKADFHVGAAPGTSSLFSAEGEAARRNHDEVSVTETIKVQVRTVDSYCAEEGIDRISCMKLDVQGAELMIFKGAKRMLTEQRIDILMFEWFAVPHYDNCPLLGDLWHHLSGVGYSAYDIFPGRSVRATGQRRFGDAVFISDRFRRENLEEALAPESGAQALADA